ncbi:MAG TPA: hypothetical protein VF744_20670 [Beijerinckiaceae bacterium]|jgi:hypothetical protein
MLGRFLDPDRVRIASQAFDSALQSLGATAVAVRPHRVRHLVASFIVERVMYGEHDPERLARGAVESLEIVGQATGENACGND